jgi:hypothetical protein
MMADCVSPVAQSHLCSSDISNFADVRTRRASDGFNQCHFGRLMFPTCFGEITELLRGKRAEHAGSAESQLATNNWRLTTPHPWYNPYSSLCNIRRITDDSRETFFQSWAIQPSMAAGKQGVDAAFVYCRHMEETEMAICDDCANKRHCTYSHTDSTYSCEEYDVSEPQVEEIDWNLSQMMADWGFKAEA